MTDQRGQPETKVHSPEIGGGEKCVPAFASFFHSLCSALSRSSRNLFPSGTSLPHKWQPDQRRWQSCPGGTSIRWKQSRDALYQNGGPVSRTVLFSSTSSGFVQQRGNISIPGLQLQLEKAGIMLGTSEQWESTNVLICGGDPTSSLLSALLGQQRVSNVVLEREPEITTRSARYRL